MRSPEDPIFFDEDSARQYIETMRWPGGPCCTRCGSQRVTRMGGRTQAGMLLCRECRNKFTCRMGTAMEHSHVPLHKWLRALLTVTTGDRHLSAQKLKVALDLGSYRTAWLVAQRLREALSRYRRESGFRVPRDGHGSAAVEAGERAAAIKGLSFDEAALAVFTFVHAEKKRRKVKPKLAPEGGELNWELNLALEAHCASVTGQPKAEATGQAAPEPANVGGALRERRPARTSRASGEDFVERDVIPSMVAYGVAAGGPGLSRSGAGLELPPNVTHERSS
jgi:Transposase zinc-ribbon domain